MKTVLIIAATDPSGGAGAFADVRTATLCGCYAMAVPTALTVQNTQGVKAVVPLAPDLIAHQLETVLEDVTPDAVKIGAVPDEACAQIIVQLLRRFQIHPVVFDPVIASTGGVVLGNPSAARTICACCKLVTPNLPEAALLTEEIQENSTALARRLALQEKTAFLVKGGHRTDGSLDDVLALPDGSVTIFPTQITPSNHTHGTGCFLSTAIACGLATGMPLFQSIHYAKMKLEKLLKKSIAIGHGNGPVGM